jgi:hypothetical protein
VTVTPTSDIVVPFGAVQLTATPKDASGNELSGRTVDWSTSNANIAAVSSSGLVSGVALGTATITATAEGKSGSASIAVKDGRAVGSSGATVTGLNGAVTLVIPPGALAQLTNVFIEAAQGLPAEPRLVAGTAVEIGPTGTNFLAPATLTIRYPPANLPAGTHPDSLTLDTYSNGFWSPLAGSTVDTAAKTLHGPVTHLSTYGTLLPPRLASVDVVSRKLRVPLLDFDLCVNQSYAVIIALSDQSGNPIEPDGITAESGDPGIATVKPISNSPDQFFMHGAAPGSATVTFTSGAISRPVTAHVTACATPAILATSDKDGNLELYRYQTGVVTRLTNNPAADGLGQVSPDGSKIGFQSDRDGTDLKLYLMDPDGANVRPLLTSQGFQRELAWAPDGTWLVGVGPKSNGHPGIYRVNADGTGATLLTPNLSTEEGFPAISPGGDHVAYHQRDLSGPMPGPYRLMVVNPDGTGERQLVNNGGVASDVTPSFSPLKRGNPEIVFVRNTGTGSNLERVRLDGSHLQAFAGGNFYYRPSFCQDGEHILVTVSTVRDTGPFLIAVKDAWVPGADEPVYVVPVLRQYFQVTYFPQTTNPALVYGCKP